MRVLIAAIFVLLAATVGKAEAVTVGFSFPDDPSAGLGGRTHLGVGVSGQLLGLQDNSAMQIPSAVRFTSDLSGFGISGTTFSLSDPFDTVLGGITIVNGQVDATSNLLLDFRDAANKPFELKLNRLGSWLISPTVGVSYSEQTPLTVVAATPIPGALPLFLSALLGFGLFGWRRRAAVAPVGAR
jgi:hypothetical protein